jgi:hypothetical protein
MPYVYTPEVIYDMEALTIREQMQEQGIDLTRDQAMELAKAKLGPSKRWVDKIEEPTPEALAAIRRIADERALRPGPSTGCTGCDIGSAQHWPCTLDHRRGTADQHHTDSQSRQTAPEADVESTLNISRPVDGAGLEDGQTVHAGRQRSNKNVSKMRDISDLSRMSTLIPTVIPSGTQCEGARHVQGHRLPPAQEHRPDGRHQRP